MTSGRTGWADPTGLPARQGSRTLAAHRDPRGAAGNETSTRCPPKRDRRWWGHAPSPAPDEDGARSTTPTVQPGRLDEGINDDSQRLPVLAWHTKSPSPVGDEVHLFPSVMRDHRCRRDVTALTRTVVALAVRGASVEGSPAPTPFEVRYGEHLLVAGPTGRARPPCWSGSHSGALQQAHRCKSTLPPRGRPRTQVLAARRLHPRGCVAPGHWGGWEGILPPAAWKPAAGELSAGNQRRHSGVPAARAALQISTTSSRTTSGT